MYQGACLCGAVEYEAGPPVEDGIHACHCSQCRRWSGHYWASLLVPRASFKVTQGEDRVVWFQSSPETQRGFCGSCGSVLFWRSDVVPEVKEIIAVSAASLKEPHDLKLTGHIFCASKGGYYEITDDLPQMETYE